MAKINIEDDGAVKIARANGQSIRAAPELGEIYEGKVVKVMDFGAFVNFFGNGSKPATSPFGGQSAETARQSHLQAAVKAREIRATPSIAALLKRVPCVPT